ncbi:MAG TPA: carboxyl transferase domain-containing protein [Solirubrobacterales bacterium]|nr:carboxyl transferase domain-containing protein [Solirubrobacterales bacterium]
MDGGFHRLAIVNRGEAAMRAIRAVRELNETSGDPITLIALYTEPERQAMFVREADEAYCLDDGAGGDEPEQPSGYLDFGALERALIATDADAAWVGWGFVAEQPEFAELCERLGVVFVGPKPTAMRLLGDKVEAKRLAEEAGLPVAPWSGGTVETAAEARDHAERIGYPLLIKAAAGGGGRGIRRVDGPGELEAALKSARSEARDAFGDDSVLLEKLIEPARHVEVQLIADGQGAAWAVGVRDCSLQRRNQKVIEESRSPVLSAERERELGEAAVRLVLRAGYGGAATVEFLYQTDQGLLSFMEVNTRLQVEHPVTEMTTGLDLLKLQLEVAAGRRLEGEPPAPVGHAIEARINAEDPALGFAPAPGRIALLRFAAGPGIRIDAGVSEGDSIPPQFDSMIAKLIAWGRDRDEALARLRRALAETTIVVEGGTTNVGFLLDLLALPELRAAEIDTGWLDRRQLRGGPTPVRHAEVGLIAAAVHFADEQTAVDRATFYALARRGRPGSQAPARREIELRYSGERYRVAISEIGPSLYRVTFDGISVEVNAERLNPHERRLWLGGHGFRVVTSSQGADLLIEVDGVAHRISRDDGGLVRNPAPAVVVSIPVEPGDEVAVGDVVAVLEIMKMESSLTAPVAGRVREVLVGPNVQMGAQEPLLRIEALDAGESASGVPRVRLPIGEQVSADRETFRREGLRRLEWLVLGYDGEPGEPERILADLQGASGEQAVFDLGLVPEEHRLLSVYADVQALSRPAHEESDSEAEPLLSPREHLNAYLRSLDVEEEGLPDRFAQLLQRALAHYGVEGLNRTPELEEAGFRLFLAQQRAEQVRVAIVALLDRRLEQVDVLSGKVGEEFRELLDRLTAAAEGRDPILADLSREVRFRYFDEPVIEAATAAAYHEAEAQLAELAADPQAPARAALVEALVECPRPLAPTLSLRLRTAEPRLRRVLLEVMTRRYYRRHALEGFEEQEGKGESLLSSAHPEDAGHRRVATAYVTLEALPRAVSSLASYAASLHGGERLVADFYADYEGEPPGEGELAARLAAVLADADLPANVDRVVFAIAEPGRGRGMSAVDIFTYRRAESGMIEDELLRGVHPEMADRLQLKRLANFALERLPSSAEDVYLVLGRARDNPEEERLFALAEVRDLTAVRDRRGQVTSLPEFERMLVQALGGIRHFQAHRKPSRRPQWNRVLLYAWPVIELGPAEIEPLVTRLGPSTRGLGIEMLLVSGRLREADGSIRDRVIRFFPSGSGVVIEVDDPPERPLMPYDEAGERIVAARRRGTLHPAEIVKMVAPAHSGDGTHGDGAPPHQPTGDFTELDLDEDGRLAPVDRPLATNPAGIVVGVIRNYTERYPEGIERVTLLGDPTKSLGSLAEPECRRIIAALDLAEKRGVPLEWFALSAGAKIAMDSGTENMDWIAAVLRRIIEYTQRGGELNVVVAGINVGAQPYWNAEATMLMHARGILVMTPESAMVLTGKQALDYSGGVSAEDNFGIGGYERIMGPNGQAQYWAPDLAGACRLLLTYYEHAYVAPAERFPRRAATSDPLDRDAGEMPHHDGGRLARVGDIFSEETNPGRRAAFDIRSVMRATIDQDHPPLERWAAMRDAEGAVVWDAHLGGWPVALLGIESRPIPRRGQVPADGPTQWTSGTLFPRSSKKIARAINSVAGRRPVVVLANLAGFDGSPESMREWQLEFGAEIGRAVVNFDGPLVFCVISRYHGGAFVVFSQRLNEHLETVALEGAHASVIGGAPAAAVVFAREVRQSTDRDPRITELDERIAGAEGAERTSLRAERAELWERIHAEKQGELAAEFDAVHSVERAVEVGSVSSIIPPAELRPFLIGAIERGMQRISGEGAGDGRTRVADARPR